MKENYHELLDQILEYATIMDEREKEKARSSQAEKAIGESWMVYHLKKLKELSKEK